MSSIVNLSSELTIYHIVEAMLPRFSDSRLGLRIVVDMGLNDWGFADDGNTREREAMSQRRLVEFLFVRSSNYTKVFVWEPPKKAVGLELSAAYGEKEWVLESDHDSCWRDAVGSRLTDIYFQMSNKFKGRKMSGKPMRPCDLSEFNSFWHTPGYVEIEKCERVNPKADRFSTEGRPHTIKFRQIGFSDLEAIRSPDAKHMSDSGLLIRGSDEHKHYLNNVQLVKERVT